MTAKDYKRRLRDGGAASEMTVEVFWIVPVAIVAIVVLAGVMLCVM